MASAARAAIRPSRVLLADDHALVRAGMKALLEEIAGLKVVAEAADGREALRLIKDHSPDLVFLDLTSPGMSGLEVLEQTSKLFPDTRVIMMTAHDDWERARFAFRLGAAGYLPKSAAAAELPVAIERVLAGEMFVSIRLKDTAWTPAKLRGQETDVQSLTTRQRQVLRMLVDGHTTKSIALNLHISAKTVETHRAQLMERLNIRDLVGLVRYAIRIGLITA
jgi:DNA-binding NarL/FixJ family response regulator